MIGMVTGAVWADVTGDEKKELIITGEWMAHEFLHITEIILKKSKPIWIDIYGWWQRFQQQM